MILNSAFDIKIILKQLYCDSATNILLNILFQICIIKHYNKHCLENSFQLFNKIQNINNTEKYISFYFKQLF